MEVELTCPGHLQHNVFVSREKVLVPKLPKLSDSEKDFWTILQERLVEGPARLAGRQMR